MVGERKFPFSLTQLLLKIGKKFQLVELMFIYAEELLYLKSFGSYKCLEVMGWKLIFTPPPHPTVSVSIPITNEDKRKIPVSQTASYLCLVTFAFKVF